MVYGTVQTIEESMSESDIRSAIHRCRHEDAVIQFDTSAGAIAVSAPDRDVIQTFDLRDHRGDEYHETQIDPLTLCRTLSDREFRVEEGP